MRFDFRTECYWLTIILNWNEFVFFHDKKGFVGGQIIKIIKLTPNSWDVLSL